jgi:uncharacterized protein YggE
MRIAHAAAAMAMITAAAATPAAAQTVTTPAPILQPIEGTLLSVSAEGLVESRPDMATIQLGVQTEGATAAAALAANAQRMTGLVAALRRSGVAERDIQTSNVNVSPQYVYEEGHAPRLTGYQATNQVSAKVRNVDNVGRTIDAAVNAGGNTVQGVSFGHQDPDAVMDRARQDAITEARERGELYARGFGMRVARVISVSEQGAYQPPMPMPMMARMEAAQDASTPVSPGQIETRINVNVVFELR